jgi:hypothetical protein
MMPLVRGCRTEGDRGIYQARYARAILGDHPEISPYYRDPALVEFVAEQMKRTPLQAREALAAFVSYSIADLLEAQPKPGLEFHYMDELRWLMALPKIGDSSNLETYLEARIAVLLYLMDSYVEQLLGQEEIAA